MIVVFMRMSLLLRTVSKLVALATLLLTAVLAGKGGLGRESLHEDSRNVMETR